MAIKNGFRVDCNEVFPMGVGIVGSVTSVSDFDKSSKDRQVQALDKESGLPLWQVDVMDFDPEARERTFKVKIAAPQQPVPPDAATPNLPIRPVYLEGLVVQPYMKSMGMDRDTKRERFKVGYLWRASGLVAPRVRRTDGKAA